MELVGNWSGGIGPSPLREVGKLYFMGSFMRNLHDQKRDVITFDESRKRGNLQKKYLKNRKISLLESTKHDKANANDQIAMPNDLSQSVRPSYGEKGKSCLTPFTRKPRYHYVDSDYAFTKDEAEKHEEHKNRYTTTRDKKALVAEKRDERVKLEKMEKNLEKSLKAGQSVGKRRKWFDFR